MLSFLLPSSEGRVNDWLNLKPEMKLLTGPGSALLMALSNCLMIVFLNSEVMPLVMADSTWLISPLPKSTLRLE